MVRAETALSDHKVMENVKLMPELQVTALCYLLALFALERLKGRCAAHMSSAERGKQMEACSEHIPQKTPSCQSRFYYFFFTSHQRFTPKLHALPLQVVSVC